eukprot:TRINITY_DN7395_c0_g1_i2.p1 TRINITY_DN7395_c0_g1~~TRINITY_DN7395_c0_g1_i2.p1  ORF type:complete len:196 (-),score=58.48 TRINITY_DN7395_c0_g1_i2:449-1036(-)
MGRKKGAGRGGGGGGGGEQAQGGGGYAAGGARGSVDEATLAKQHEQAAAAAGTGAASTAGAANPAAKKPVPLATAEQLLLPPPGLPPSSYASAKVWWQDLTEDDPITMEPLANLDAPPFALSSGVLNSGKTHYFDSVALASYVTRRAVFENPLTREPMSRDDCARLDEHVKRYLPRCRAFNVADAWDLQRAIKVL